MSRAMRHLLVVFALGAGALAAFAGEPRPDPAADEMTALDLAQRIRARQSGLVLLDLRPEPALQIERLPGAQPAADLDPAALGPDDIVVVYADTEVDSAVVDTLRRRWNLMRVLRLHGGKAAWNQDVLFPVVRGDASARQRREFASRAALSRYFGGTPRVLDPGATSPLRQSRGGC